MQKEIEELRYKMGMVKETAPPSKSAKPPERRKQALPGTQSPSEHLYSATRHRRRERKALRTLAKTFWTTAQTRDASTSSILAAALLGPHLNLLHYYGYATFEEEAVKDHELELDDRRFTLRDIFDLELDSCPHSRGHHVTLLGCDSGMYKTSLSNDILGLVPAYLYSGASSTVSTPRPFDDKDAAMYTREFYKDFGKVAVIDLAKANRRAMLAIMEKRPALYHWGSSVVIGYWISKVG